MVRTACKVSSLLNLVLSLWLVIIHLDWFDKQDLSEEI